MHELFSPAELAELAAYHRPLYAWAALGDAVNLLFYALMLRFGVRPLHAYSAHLAGAFEARGKSLRGLWGLRAVFKALERLWGGPGWGTALLFASLYFLVTVLAYLPVDFYFDFLHEQKYGLSGYTPATYAIDSLKGTLLGLMATLALSFGLFGLARRLRSWWLWLGALGAAFLVLSASLDPFRSRVLFEQAPLPEGTLRRELTALLTKAQVEFASIVVERSSRASRRLQAYFAGVGPTRSVVLNDRILEELSGKELLAAVAHEAAHVRESRRLALFGSAAALWGFLFLVHRLLERASRSSWLGAQGYGDIRALPLLGLAFYLCVGVARPVGAFFSRQRELDADRFAVELTGDPLTFRAMLAKVTRLNKADPAPPDWVVLRGAWHPSLAMRLSALDELSKETGGGE